MAPEPVLALKRGQSWNPEHLKRAWLLVPRLPLPLELRWGALTRAAKPLAPLARRWLPDRVLVQAPEWEAPRSLQLEQVAPRQAEGQRARLFVKPRRTPLELPG